MSDAETLAKRKRIQAGHRASATRIIGDVEKAQSAEVPDTAKLSLLKMSLNEKLQTLAKLDNEIAELIEDETALGDEIVQADGFKECIFAALINIEKVTAAATATDVPVPLSSTIKSTVESDPSLTSSRRESSTRVKLPKLNLRSFNGDITKWTTFLESYESAIHKNEELSDIDKFNYLSSLLERTARDAISGLAMTAANYSEAISILKRRFGSKQQIISKHMDILLNVEPVTSHNTKAMRRLYDTIESHIRSLKSLGVASETYGSLLSPVLLQKLPTEMRLIVSREIADKDWKLDSLLEVIQQEIEARERVVPSQSYQTRATEKTPSTATTLVSGASQPTTPSCCYCQQNHSSNNCRVVTQIDERKQILKRSGRCFICLRKGHISRTCRSPNKCSICNGRHHSTICIQRSGQVVPPSTPNTSGSSTTNAPSSRNREELSTTNPQQGLAVAFEAQPTTNLYTEANKPVLLQTAMADIYNPQKPELTNKVRIVLDSGSQHSYITKRAKDALQLKSDGEHQLRIAAFGSKRADSQCCEVVDVRIKLRHGPDKELLLYTVAHICDPLIAQPISVCAEMYSHLSQLELADDSNGETPLEVDMLIGSDYYWELTTGKIRRGQNGPIAMHTKLGWVLSGPTDVSQQASPVVSLITTHVLKVNSQCCEIKELECMLHSFWKLESLGICEPDKSIHESFDNNIKFKEGRYEVSLPWKECHTSLPTNYELSEKRLYSLMYRLRQNPKILQEYNAIIQEQIANGIVQVVDKERDANVKNRIHYLPHHAVVRQDRNTTKVRIVYDASARSGGPSLNDCLYTGPKFNQKILNILLRFRTHKFALTADIEKAFLMISMNEEDRDVLRFLWVEDISQDQPKLIVLRFTLVVFGVSSSPFLLNATIKHHIEKHATTYPQVAKEILNSIYVDDVVFGAEDEEAAYKLYVESKEMLRKGSFNLRKFVTNSQRLQDKINQVEGLESDSTAPNKQDNDVEETYAKSVLGCAEVDLQSSEHIQKVLGVTWHASTDQLVFDLCNVARQAVKLELTKRNIVSLAGRFYDPFGFLSPFTIRFKVLIQELCEIKIDWDQVLDGPTLRRWKSLVNDLQEVQPISLPRCYFRGVNGEVKSCQLQGFCDSSVKAYAAVVYLVIETDTEIYGRFVVSKTRVSPLQTQTIPRLELLSALLLTRLVSSTMDSLSPQLSLTQPMYSRVALFWIRGLNREWKPFVQNRVNEIRKLTTVESWNHCPGRNNPADVATRGTTPLELSVNMLWRTGPEYLYLNSEEDSSEQIQEIPEECLAELKASDRKLVQAHSLMTSKPSTGIGQIMQCENYSSLSRLLKVTAYVLKFVRSLKRAIQSGTTDSKESENSIVSSTDVAEAEQLWIIESQSSLLQSRHFDTWKRQFNLFLDDSNVWRCGGRLSNANLPYSSKHPIILSKDNPLTRLIVKDAHERVHHNGVKETLTQIRSKYWIVKGRSLVKMLTGRCVLCRRLEGRPFSTPLPPPLPDFRIKEAPAFTNTAVDFAGPLYIKTHGVTKTTKVWICLYTCCITRAIHLDVVPDMSATTFIRSLKRFCARRGLLQKFLSDNGKTFKAAARIIQSIVTHPDIINHLTKVKVEWTFNLERAPWWGGVFERMVKSVKRCLRKMIGQARFTHDELLTAVVEVEAIVNSRPLSYVSADDMEEPLTPSHLISGRRLLSLPDNLCHMQKIDDEDFELTPDHLNKRLKHLNNVLNHFWERWKYEYLLELREAHRFSRGSSVTTPVQVGDIVVVHDQGQLRSFWKLAKIKQLITGKDGQVRGAILRVPAKDGKTTTLQRPLQLLYPLEIDSNKSHSLPEANPKTEAQVKQIGEEREDPTPRRSSRVAAIQARDRIKACTQELNYQASVDHLVANAGEDVGD